MAGDDTREMPEALEWLLRIESWRALLGDLPLRPGGLLEQPYHFVEDLLWADLGRQRAYRAQEINSAAAAAEASRTEESDTTNAPTIDLGEVLGINA